MKRMKKRNREKAQLQEIMTRGDHAQRMKRNDIAEAHRSFDDTGLAKVLVAGQQHGTLPI